MCNLHLFLNGLGQLLQTGWLKLVFNGVLSLKGITVEHTTTNGWSWIINCLHQENRWNLILYGYWNSYLEPCTWLIWQCYYRSKDTGQVTTYRKFMKVITYILKVVSCCCMIDDMLMLWFSWICLLRLYCDSSIGFKSGLHVTLQNLSLLYLVVLFFLKCGECPGNTMLLFSNFYVMLLWNTLLISIWIWNLEVQLENISHSVTKNKIDFSF